MRKHWLAIVLVPLLFWAAGATAGDAAAGKAAYEEKCADCHEADDFAGETKEDILGFMAEVKADATGTKDKDKAHAAMTDEDKANIAAYWASVE